MFSNTSEIIQNLAIQEVTPISEDAFYLEYSNAGTAESYCLHFTFRTIAKAEAFFEMTSMYGFPIERVGNQVIMLPSPDSLTPGIWLCNKEEIAFITKNIDAADWIKFINENHANGDLVKYNGQRSENDDKIVSFYRCGGHCSININLFQSKFSLVERITKTEQFMGHSVFFILFVVNHLSELNSMPKELVPFIMMRLLTEKIDENVVVLNQTFPFPLQLVDKYKKTDYFLECNQHTNILHLLCSNDTEANLLFNQLNRNVPNLFLKRYHNEILMHSSSPSTSTSNCKNQTPYTAFFTPKPQTLFFKNSINMCVKTKDNPKLVIQCPEADYLYIPADNLRIRTNVEIAIFNDVIYPILAFIDDKMIARLQEGAITMALSALKSVCSFVVDNQNTVIMNEVIKNKKIACLIHLKNEISEGLRIKTPLEDIINTWYQSTLIETEGKTVYEIIHLDRENNTCEHTGTSMCVDDLLKGFSEKCKIAFEVTDCPNNVMNKYSHGFVFGYNRK